MASRRASVALFVIALTACSGTVAIGQGSGSTGGASTAPSSSNTGNTASDGGASTASGGGASTTTPPPGDGGSGGAGGSSTDAGATGGSGSADACSPCVPQTCLDQGQSCGPTSDGCGNVIECGGCGPPPGCCAAVTDPPVVWSCGIACDIVTCAAVGVSCGIVPSGCGDMLDCGSCTAPETCGGGGTPGVCGTGSCLPRTCADQGYDCGPAGDGCGGVLDCGSCDPCTPTCGADTLPGHCLATLVSTNCLPKTCAALGTACGPAADGCGGLLQCGACPSGTTCNKGQCAPACM
jgi:hypothetical protein